MNKTDVELRLHPLFAARDWDFRRLCKLGAAFVRDRPVTPYFRPRVLRKRPGVYQIDGYVGVIDQEFERTRIRSAARPAGGHSPCLSLNIANLKPLLGVQDIHEISAEKNLKAFADTVTGLMETMPHDADALAAAFAKNMLLGVPFENYAVTERHDEFEALRRFVSREAVR